MWYAKKHFGQHFLTDAHAIEKMCEAAHVQEENNTIEIGPGKGVLTLALLERGATVYAIEKDNDLIPLLEERFAEYIQKGRLVLIHKDIRDIDDSVLPQGDYKLIANIPYYITGEIIRLFLTRTHHPTSITILIQEEVARRICNDEKTNLLQLSVCAYGTPHYIKKVKAGSFNPPPKVDSAIIHISNISKDNFQHVSEKRFFDILHAAFNQKRKTVLKSLSVLEPKEKVLKALILSQIEPNARPEDISLEQWLSLSSCL